MSSAAQAIFQVVYEGFSLLLNLETTTIYSTFISYSFILVIKPPKEINDS